MSLELSENELLELASKDIDGEDLLKYVQNKHKNWHPTRVIEFLDVLFKDKKYCKLVASLLTVKFQRIRSNLLKQVDTLMTDGDVDILKSVDKLLQLVIKFSQLDDDEKSDNRLIIRLSDGKEEKFRPEQIQK
jgi:hypothetical protein